MRNTGRFIGLAAAILGSLTLNACNKMGSPAAAHVSPLANAGIPVGKPGGEVDAAREVLKQLGGQKSVTGMAPYLSNRSAAATGVVMTIPLAMMSAFAEMGEEMAREFSKAGGQSGTKVQRDPAQDKKLKQIKGVTAEIDAIMKKHGVEKSAGPAAAAKLESRGREFLYDIGALLDRFGKMEAAKDQDLSPKTGDFVKRPDQVEFQVVSAAEVKIIPKDKKETPARAIVEDGKWRLDFGGLDQLGTMMGANQAHAGSKRHK